MARGTSSACADMHSRCLHWCVLALVCIPWQLWQAGSDVEHDVPRLTPASRHMRLGALPSSTARMRRAAHGLLAVTRASPVCARMRVFVGSSVPPCVAGQGGAGRGLGSCLRTRCASMHSGVFSHNTRCIRGCLPYCVLSACRVWQAEATHGVRSWLAMYSGQGWREARCPFSYQRA